MATATQHAPVEFVGGDVKQPDGDYMYVVITGSKEDVNLVRAASNLPTVGVWGGKTPREAIDALNSYVRLDTTQINGFVILAPPTQSKYVEIAAELIRRLNPDKTYVPRDADWGGADTLTGLLEEGVRHMISRSRLVPISAVLDSQDLIDRAIDQFRNPTRDEGASTGWTLLDAHYRPAPGYVTIVTGVPSHGKSTWLDAMLAQIAQLHDQRFAIFSPESYPVSRHALRLASRISGQPWLGQGRMTDDNAHWALQWVSEHFWFMDPDVGLTIDAVLESAEKLLRRYGINGLVIDPWNELEHSRPKDMTETEYVSVILGRVRRWARAHRVHVWIVAHPAKPPKQMKKRRDDEDDEPYIPTPYDISGSANWYNKADAAITIWRDPRIPGGYTTVHVQKVRVQPEQGCPGAVLMAHDQRTGTYRDVPLHPKTQMPQEPRPSRVPATFLRDWVASRTQQQQAA